MRKLALITLFIFLVHALSAQRIRVIVPAEAVVSGNAFQVQYIIAEPEGLQNIQPPLFDSLQLVSGPHRYSGTAMVDGKMQTIENIAYTLLSTRAGTFYFTPLTATFKTGVSVSSPAASVQVVPPPKASFSAHSSFTDVSLYAPPATGDLDQLVRENLFIKTIAAPKTCYVGEPVTVVFRLYSSLQSTSEVINAPSLYGFSVMDVLDINHAYPGVETINDRVYNTSVLRKLQLYPEQSGKLVIDEMELDNEIEFDDPLHRGKKIKVQKQLSSQPVTIDVKPLPLPRPADFIGAVGRFHLFARLASGTFRAGEQGRLIVTVSGKGNFIQFAAPQIQWPPGFNVFEPVVDDSLDRNVAAVEGSREYIFSFSTDSAGLYHIPPVAFSFFDPSLRSYRQLQTDSLLFQVLPQEYKREKGGFSRLAGPGHYGGLILVLTLVLLAGGLVFFFYRRKTSSERKSISNGNYYQKLEALEMSALSDKQACAALEKILALAGMHYTGMTTRQQLELRSIRNECQELVYSEMNTEGKKEDLKKRAVALLRQLES